MLHLGLRFMFEDRVGVVTWVIGKAGVRVGFRVKIGLC